MTTMEEDIYEEIQIASNETAFDEKIYSRGHVKLNQPLYVSMALIGLSIQILILLVIIPCKRLRSRAILVIANYLVCDSISTKAIPTLINLVPLHHINFTIHIILANMMGLFYLFGLIFLNALISETLMTTNRYSFKAFMDRTHIAMMMSGASIICWKFFRTDAYLELVMVIIMGILGLALILRMIYQQIVRFIGVIRRERKKTDPITELRLHLVTFYICGQFFVVVTVTVLAALFFRSSPMLNLIALWHLNGLYVLILLFVKDTNFRCRFLDMVLWRKPNDNDIETQDMIGEASKSRDKDLDDETANTSKEDIV